MKDAPTDHVLWTRPRAYHALLVPLLLGLVTACKTPPDAEPKTEIKTDTKTEPKAEIKTDTKVAATGCAADQAWITTPSLPTEIATPATNCAFQQFMWQSLLYLVQPSKTQPGSIELETFMPSYGIFVGAQASPTAWGDAAPHPCTPPDGSSKAPLFSDIIKQAGAAHPLLDKSGTPVFYAISINHAGYDMLTQCDLYRSSCASNLEPGNPGIDLVGQYPQLALPSGTIELKSAWRVVPDGDPTAKDFYTAEGWIQDPTSKQCKLVTLGMVGLHVVSKTPDHPELVWATFEHRSNAPDCTDLASSPPVGDAWTFFDAKTCESCETNQYRPPDPTQVCRMHPWGDPTVGIAPNGNDCDADPKQPMCKPEVSASLADNTKNMVELNRAVATLIEANPTAIASVWANYELVGNLWTRDGALPPASTVQEGSLAAANTVMETYVQNGEAGVTNPNNCFSCHNLDSATFGVQLPPAGISHIFHELQPNTEGCADGKLPASCAPYH